MSRADAVRVAARLRLSLPDVCDRLSVLGFSVPAFRNARSVTAEDVRLVSVDADGESPWLPDDEFVDRFHVLFLAARLRLPPRVAASRLYALGYDLPSGSELPETIMPELRRLIEASPGLRWARGGISSNRRSSSDDDRSAPKGHVIAIAAVTGLTCTAVAGALTSLGYVVSSVTDPSEPLTEQHARLVSYNLDGKPPWLQDKKQVPRCHLVRAAHALSWDLRKAAGTLRALGYQAPMPLSSSVTVTDSDIHLIGQTTDYGRTNWLADRGPIIGHMVAVVQWHGWNVATAAMRLTELGYTVPAIPSPPATVTKTDVRLVSLNLNGDVPWLPDAREVPKAFVAMASATLGWTIPEVAARLAGFGYQVADISSLPDDLDKQDKKMLTDVFDRPGDPWLRDLADVAAPQLSDTSNISMVSRAHVIAIAATAGRQIHDVAARLSQLGFNVPELADLPETIREADSELIAGHAKWRLLPDEAAIALPRLLHAAQAARMTLPAAARRLAELGYPVRVHADDLPGQPSPSDLRLISRDFNREGLSLPEDKEVPPDHLLGAAIALGMTVKEAAARLERFGYRVSPVREFSSPGAYLRAMEAHKARLAAEEQAAQQVATAEGTSGPEDAGPEAAVPGGTVPGS